MVLEASMIILDNSEWMRNGDYTPSRFEAQNDAVNMIFAAKTQSNPENTVGLMTMSGESPEVLVTFTSDVGKVLSAIHKVKIKGTSSLSTSIQIAQLALKHRQNKNQRQRVIAFVASPVNEDEKSLVRLAKKLKKNNIAIDIINFGEDTENSSKLEAFINAVNNNENSHLVTIPPGPNILSDVLISSPIVSGEDGAPGFVAGGGAYEFGVDPNLDPELALALRISLEEERARQESESKKNQAESKVESDEGKKFQSEEDKLLAQALAMSMGNAEVELSEEEQIARAIQMSIDGTGNSSGTSGQDANYLNSVISNLPGVDPNDPRIKGALKKDDKKKSKKKDDHMEEDPK